MHRRKFCISYERCFSLYLEETSGTAHIHVVKTKENFKKRYFQPNLTEHIMAKGHVPEFYRKKQHLFSKCTIYRSKFFFFLENNFNWGPGTNSVVIILPIIYYIQGCYCFLISK